MIRILSITHVLLVMCTGNAFADVYKCVDKQGHIVFQPVECAADAKTAEKINIDSLLSGQNRVVDDHQSSSPPLTNLLLNADFEQQLSHWRVPVDTKWFPAHGINSSGVLQLSARKPPDDKYIHETVVKQCVPIGDGIKFSLGGSFRHEGRPVSKHANRLRVIWYASPDCTKGGQWGGYVEPADVSGWQYLSRDNLTPALSAQAAMVEIMQNGRYSNRAMAYWDNIYLVATEAAAAPARQPGYSLPANFDFIENGDFRRDLSAWRTGWRAQWVGYTGHHGVGAIKVTASSTKSSIGKGAFNQCVNFGSSQRFAMGASFKRVETSTQKGGGRLRVTWYEKGDCRGRARTDRHADPEDISGWQALRVDNLQAEPGSVSARIEIIQTVLGPGEFSAYWDDVYFKTIE